MKYDVVVVGSGFAGSVIARRYAEEQNKRVLIVEKHNHIGGHAYDEYNEDGVLIHCYGPHIFHTTHEAVWEWLSRFTKWNLYQHRVLSYVDGMYVPMPISSETINTLFGENLTVYEAQKWMQQHAQCVDQVQNSRDVVLSGVGQEIYDKFFKNYTFKQWGKYPEDLSPEVIKRIPLRNTRDSRYFTDKYQGVPLNGYSTMFKSITDHESIHIMLNTDWFDVSNEITFDKLVYTGPVDRFFDYQLGKLEYRSVKFEYETYYDRSFYQTVGTVNYPNDYGFTRISEYKHFTGQKISHTTIAKEYSTSSGDPFYPILDTKNQLLAQKYKKLCIDETNVIFIGRLAEYAYFNMDIVVKNALECVID